MPARDDQSVSLSDWKGVFENDGKLMTPDNALIWDFTKRTPFFSMIEDLIIVSKIRVITITFHRIAAVAKGLKIRHVIATILIPWDNMVDFQSFDI